MGTSDEERQRFKESKERQARLLSIYGGLKRRIEDLLLDAEDDTERLKHMLMLGQVMRLVKCTKDTMNDAHLCDLLQQ